MSDPGKVIIVLSAFGTLTYLVRFIAQQFVNAGRESRRSRELIDPADDRLARLEQAVESIAIEVERISEGQRFTTKLLTERAQADQLRVAEQPALDRRAGSTY
jgi:hypothetical protein